MKDKISCPYPDHPGYMAVRDTLSPEEQMRMAETIRITADKKVEIVPLHKKFSLLSAEHNGVDIFSGDFKDAAGKQGKKGATYFSVDAAVRECTTQGKQLIPPYEQDMEGFVTHFPGKNNREKMRSIIKIFDLDDIGWLDFFNYYKWHINKVCYVLLTSRDALGGAGKMEWLSGDSDYPHYGLSSSEALRPVLAFEDC